MKVLGHKIELLTGTAGLSPPLPLCAALAARYLPSWSGAWWLWPRVWGGSGSSSRRGCRYQLSPSLCAAGSCAEPGPGRGLGAVPCSALLSEGPGVWVGRALAAGARV